MDKVTITLKKNGHKVKFRGATVLNAMLSATHQHAIDTKDTDTLIADGDKFPSISNGLYAGYHVMTDSWSVFLISRDIDGTVLVSFPDMYKRSDCWGQHMRDYAMLLKIFDLPEVKKEDDDFDTNA